MTANDLRATAVEVDFGGGIALREVNLAVPGGTMLAITGPSGSGKSTLARVLAGIRPPERGAVSLGGFALGELTGGAERPVLVPQDFGLVATLTALETVGLPLQLRAYGRNDVAALAARWLDALGLESCSNRLVTELSGGQRQRVAIARALAVGAGAIVLDDPTAELDAANRDLVLRLLGIELERGVAIVVVSHEADVLARADALYELPALRRAASE